MSNTPGHPWSTWWLRVPGFVVGLTALLRAEWLADHAPDSISTAWWVPVFVVWFAAVGVGNLVWHAAAPWRERDGHGGTCVALITFACWMLYSLAILNRIGWNVRATSADLAALAIMIAWTWGPNRTPLGEDR